MHPDGAQALHAALQVAMEERAELHPAGADVEPALLARREAILKRRQRSKHSQCVASALSGIRSQGRGGK